MEPNTDLSNRTGQNTDSGAKEATSTPAATTSTPAAATASTPAAATASTPEPTATDTSTGANRQTLPKSFANAWEGIVVCVLEERNIKIHCFAAVMVLLFGFILRISVTEWCICFVLFGLIMGLELVNTAVESVVDLVTEEWHPLAKRAKDCAAGAVLIASIWAAVTGGIVFFPKLYYFIAAFLGK